jgi:hypothetical protein
LTRTVAAIAVLLGFTLSMPGFGFSITCDECLKIDKEKKVIALKLSKQREALSKAFKDKEFRKVTQIRIETNALRKKLMAVKSKGKGCEDACKPDVVKRSECRAIKVKIQKLESGGGTSPEALAKVDKLYDDLAKCNNELSQIH